MQDPWTRLKRLPWLVLLQVAILTAIATIVLETALIASISVIPPLENALQLLLSPNLAFFTLLAAALGVGALSVVILERFQRVVINAGSLWALIACLALVFWLVDLLRLFPLGLVGVARSGFVGILLGVFFKGERYWKSYRRW